MGDISVGTGTFLIPISLTLFLNYITFFAILGVLVKKMRSKRSNAAANFKMTLGIFSISIVFGLTWIFFLFAIGWFFFIYPFVVFNTLQGFFIFVLVAVIGTKGRHFWMNLFQLKKSVTSRGSQTNSNRKSSSSSMPISPPPRDRNDDGAIWKGTLPKIDKENDSRKEKTDDTYFPDK